MAELATEGVASKSATSALAPTEITECFCNLEGDLLFSGRDSVADGTSRRRKSSGRASVSTSMLLHLSPKQLLVARKPTLMEDLITRNKTALLLNKMERSRVSKNKRSEVDSDPEPLAIKRLRTNEPIKAGRQRKSSEDRKMRTTTRRFTSSLRSGKKRTHIKDSMSIIDEKRKRALKSSGTRSNDSGTDTPSSTTSSTKANGHLDEKPARKVVEKLEKKIIRPKPGPSDGSSKAISVRKIHKSQKDKSGQPLKKIRKKRRKVDSMIWLKNAKQKAQNKSKLSTDLVIKTEPIDSEPEDSGLGSEMKLDLSKSYEKPLSENSNVENVKLEIDDAENTCSDVVSSAGNHLWTIEAFNPSPLKVIPSNQEEISLITEPHSESLDKIHEIASSKIPEDNLVTICNPFKSSILQEENVTRNSDKEDDCYAEISAESSKDAFSVQFENELFKNVECEKQDVGSLKSNNSQESKKCIKPTVNGNLGAFESEEPVQKVVVCSDIEKKYEESVLQKVVVTSDIEKESDGSTIQKVVVTSDIEKESDESIMQEVVVTSDIEERSEEPIIQKVVVTSDIEKESGKSVPQEAVVCSVYEKESEESMTCSNIEIESDKSKLQNIMVTSDVKRDTEDNSDVAVEPLVVSEVNEKSPGELSIANKILKENSVIESDLTESSDLLNDFCLSTSTEKHTALDMDNIVTLEDTSSVSKADATMYSNEGKDIHESDKELVQEPEGEFVKPIAQDNNKLPDCSQSILNDVVSFPEKSIDNDLDCKNVSSNKMSEESESVETSGMSSPVNQEGVNGINDKSQLEEMIFSSEVTENSGEKVVNGEDMIEENTETIKSEEGVEQQALKADWLKALGLQSLRPTPGGVPSSLPEKDIKEEKAKVSEPGYTTGTLKAVIKLNKGAPRSIVFKNNDDAKNENPSSTEEFIPVPDNVNRKSKEGLPVDNDSVSVGPILSEAPQSMESDEDKSHGKESNLIIPEKSSSFSIHPGRLCCDVCCYCFGKFGSLDTPCHIAQLKGEERQQKILQNEPYLTVDSCLCDACYRYVDRKANCPSSAAAKTAKRARPPAATLCCVTDCTLTATHSVKRKWLLKIKRSLANKFEIDTEKHTSVFNPLCSNHHYWVDYYMVCGICRKRLNRNHLYTLGPETDRLNLVLAEDGIPARLSDKLFLCKLCRYYANMRLKYSDPSTIPPSSQPFYVNYRKKILSSLDVPVSDSDEDKPAKTKENKDEDVMSLSGLATLLSDQPEPNQPRIQVKFGNVNIGTLSNLNIGQGRQDERSSFDRNDPSNLPLNASFDFQGPSTSDGAWEKVTSTLQFDKKTKQLWQDLQRPYGNQSSFLRHLVMLEKYWRSGFLVLSDTADARTAKYLTSVQTRNKSFEGQSEVKAIKVEPAEIPTTPPLQEPPILKVPDPSRRTSVYSEDSTKVSTSNSDPPKKAPTGGFLMPTGEVEVLPVNPNSRNVAKEKPVSKGTVIIQRPSTSLPSTSQSPCKIMITSVQSLAKPKVDPILLHRAKSLVRMVTPTPSSMRQIRPTLPTPIQRLPRMARPRQPLQFMQQQPYQTLQAQLQTPPGSNPLQSLQQVVVNRCPPPPLVKINQMTAQQQRAGTPRPPTSNSVLLHKQSQPAVSLIQQLNQPVVSMQHHSIGILQSQPSITLVQQPSVSFIQQKQPSVSFIQQQPSISFKLQNKPSIMHQLQQVSSSQPQNVKSVTPPPPPYRPLLPKLPSSLSISTTPQSTTPNLTPSVSLLPPSSSSPSISLSGSLPSVSTLTSLRTPPPYTTTVSQTPSVSIIPATPQNSATPLNLPSSITLSSSGITIEKQPHNFASPPILPPEKPIISVFREPLPTQDT